MSRVSSEISKIKVLVPTLNAVSLNSVLNMRGYTVCFTKHEAKTVWLSVNERIDVTVLYDLCLCVCVNRNGM